MHTDTTSADRLSQSLRDLMIALSRSDRQIADIAGLNTSDLMCLGFIEAASGPVTPTMLSELVGMSTGSTTALIDRLERRGLLIRRRHPHDRRGVVLELDTAAMDASGITALRARLRQVLIPVTSGLSASEVELVTTLLQGIVAELEKIELASPA
jgi:DNA-binding MarR family transcriptional regulator